MNTENETHQLSASQRAVWFDQQLNPDDSSYSVWDFAEIDGKIDLETLLAAIEHVVSRTSALHLRFGGDPLNPNQLFAAASAPTIAVIDFSFERNAVVLAREWMTAEARKPFDYANSLFRTAIIKLGTDRLCWFRNCHHLIADGFSFVLLGQYVANVYSALISGSALPERFVDFREQLATELDYRRSPQMAADKKFWLDKYSELPEPVTLSARGAIRPSRREARLTTRWLPSQLLDRLYELETAQGISVGQLLVAAVAIYMHRITGAADIPICMPVHGRERGRAMEMIGMCVNTLPMRFSFSPGCTTREALEQVSVQIAGAMSHRRHPFDELKKELGLRPGGVNPFRIHANVLRSLPQWKFGDCSAHVETGATGPCEDLSFFILENRARRTTFRLTLVWNPQLYEEWEAERHQDYFLRTLTAMVEDIDTPIMELPLVTPAERNLMLFEWNATAKQFADDCCFHQLFERQVAATPNFIAARFGSQQLTYMELDRRANRLAAFLLTQQVQPDQVIGLCLERSLELMIGLIGIMKAGAAFLPLDPDVPQARLRFVISDAGVRLVVSDTSLTHVFDDLSTTLTLVCIDTLDIAHTDRESVAPKTDARADNLAYVIYTSGSTGTPKGVLIQHRGLCNLCAVQSEIFGIGARTRVLQFARLSFDAAISEIAVSLSCGAELVIPDKYAVLPGALERTLHDHDIEVATLPPQILPYLREDSLQALKTLVVAGEVCPVSEAEKWSEQRRFINAYGPTEATVCTTCFIYDGKGKLPIGKPIANMETYVLDEKLSPLPIGVAGELFIGGIGLARGYLNRPDLTASAFLPHPFRSEEDARIYRSGDLARYMPDGNIEFLARRDRQIKVRGFRVELEEIEHVLRSCDGVKACAVLDEVHNGQTQLVAYLVTEDAEFNVKGIRSSLARALPDYMSPSLYKRLDELPATRSGKLDRSALRSGRYGVIVRPKFVPPRDHIEASLAEIWSRFLGAAEIGVMDNFFELGGHSLLAIQVIVAIEDSLAVRLPPGAIFESFVLEELAARIREELTRHPERGQQDDWRADIGFD